MVCNYNGVTVEWTAKEAAKIAEIKGSRPPKPNDSLPVPDMPAEEAQMAAYDKKRSTYEAMYWLWRCDVDYTTIADMFGTSREVVRLAVKNRRGNRA